MIHSVYFWLKKGTTDEQRAAFREALEELARIDRIQSARVGTPAATAERPVTDHSFDFSIHFEFATRADHDAYQDHPGHHAFIEKGKDLWEKVIVYDSRTR